jgi:signal peptidase
MSRTLTERFLTALVVLVAIALVAGNLLGQPILLSYVSTGSMEPTLSAGDGFVAVPQPVHGEVQEGDVVVFRAKEIHGGGLVTHRVVARTETGYVTKGDANAFTDQDGPEPMVTDDRIVATALQIGGTVVTIPQLGTTVDAVRSAGLAIQTDLVGGDGSGHASGGLGGVLVLVGTLVLGGSFVADRVGSPTRHRERSRDRDGVVRTRTIAALLLLVVLVPANTAMVAPAGSHTLGLLSTEKPDRDPYAVPPGETTSIEVPIHNDGVVPVFVVLEGDAGRIESNDRFRLPPRATREGTVSVTSPATTRPFEGTVVEHRYLAVLPHSVLGWLHDRHPWLAVLSVNLVLAVGVVALVRIVLGRGRVRLRRSDAVVATRVRRWLEEGW